MGEASIPQEDSTVGKGTGGQPATVPGAVQSSEEEQVETLSGFWTWVLGLYLVAIAIGLGLLLVGIIPTVLPKGGNPSELDLIYLVMIVGAFGSYVHAATSFASYVGNQQMGKSWVWWYLLRPLIGSALALVFYFAVRAGFMQNGADSGSVNVFGIGAMAGLTGMFSKQATDKLREVFDNFFKVSDDRKHKLDHDAAQSPTDKPATGNESGATDTSASGS